MLRPARLLRVASLFLAALLAAPCYAADEPAVVKPEDARQHKDAKVTVEFTVAAGRELADKGICFLNSEKDHKLSSNFTAFITPAGLKKFKEEAKIEQPALHFFKKKIRVTGTVQLFKEQAEIKVESPEQIKIVEAE